MSHAHLHPAFQRVIAKNRARRRAQQLRREAAGGDWRHGHWSTGESMFFGVNEEDRPQDDQEAERVSTLDLRRTDYVDWRDVDASGEWE